MFDPIFFGLSPWHLLIGGAILSLPVSFVLSYKETGRANRMKETIMAHEIERESHRTERSRLDADRALADRDRLKLEMDARRLELDVEKAKQGTLDKQVQLATVKAVKATVTAPKALGALPGLREHLMVATAPHFPNREAQDAWLESLEKMAPQLRAAMAASRPQKKRNRRKQDDLDLA